jgi:protein-S-isoprenylcysteine O-methyltransferase Ste14
MRILGFLYGAVSYAAFLASFVYAIAFVGNLPAPKTIDSGPSGPLSTALLTDALLLSLFALQHSLMARPAFKAWWTTIVPQAVERSTYVLISSLLLGLLFWQWQPITEVIWKVDNRPLRLAVDALFWLGWLVTLGATFMLNHWDLFGLRQVYLRLRRVAYTPPIFEAGALYKFVRNPIMLGFLIAFWAAADLTLGHLLFALGMTAYIFVGIHFEERELAATSGAAFEQYRKDVPMIVPNAHGTDNAHGTERHLPKLKHAKGELFTRPPSPLAGGYQSARYARPSEGTPHKVFHDE